MRSPKYVAALLVVLALAVSVSLVRSRPDSGPELLAGNGWTKLPNGPNAAGAQRHDDLCFIDEYRGWVVNGNGEVWRTSDGGNSWTRTALTGDYNRCVGFINQNTGWIGYLYQVNGTALIRTDDGGSTWNSVTLPAPAPAGVCGMQVIDSTTVVAVGAYYGTPTFIRTDDAGANWSVLDMSPYCGALVDVHFFNDQVGVAVGSSTPGPNRRHMILRTTDGGITWEVRQVGSRNRELCWKASFPNEQAGFVSIENLAGIGPTYFLKTQDGGVNWTEVFATSSFVDCQGIGFVTPYFGWIGGWNTGTAVTKDGGNSWAGGDFGFNVNRIRFLSPFLGYACGTDVYKFQLNPAGVGNGDVASGPPLVQVRPNPFSSTTRISYRVPKEGPISLRVFDVQGRPIRALIDGESAAGDFTTPFDAHGLAAGTYYYRLSTVAGSETGKLQVVP
ncbi:MAG TPA: YCF48-related protein [Candidatus Eisenbacteria bacterium]